MHLIKNAYVYAPEKMGVKDVLIGGGKILKIGEDLPVEYAYDITVIDGTGKILMPGLIDGHVHILGGGGEGGAKTRTPEIMLSDIITGGVTTVVGCLGTDGCTRTISNLLAKAKGLEEEGITTYVYTGSYQVPVRTLTGSVMDDIILLEKVVGTGEIAISDHRSSQPTKEEFAKIVADTRVGGILSGKAGLVNIHMGDGEEKLEFLRYILEKTQIPATNMLPTHINRSNALMKDGIDYAKNWGGYIDLTTSSDPDFLEPDEVKASIGLKMALDAGVLIDHVTFSSDGQGSLPIFASDGTFLGLGVGKVTSLYREMKDAVLKDGVSLSDALKPVTSNPASLLKLEHKGKISKNADADLVLADADTLEIDTVIAKGKIMIHKGQVLVKGTFERRTGSPPLQVHGVLSGGMGMPVSVGD
ncbi:Isoaspartyl dipeptidase [Clostridiales bacterium CHKCI001]|nr:Isoaspartyl dipeptidase [Clostridiales bacterium CHKCI001]